MISEYTKFKLHRRLRRAKRRGQKHTDLLHALTRLHVIKRFQRLRPVRNFVAAWWLLWLICLSGVIWQWRVLSATYAIPTPVSGGTYVEGSVGTIDNINPIFAVDGVNAAASRLVFNGLLRYDDNGVLAADLAETISADDSGTVYTIVLRDDIFWHDGEPVTSRDVVFTFSTIQHPDTRSPLNASWRDIKVEAKDERTIVFTLPNSFAPFTHSLVTGLVPEHLLGSLGPSGQRAAEFNQAPIGNGPFRFLKLDAERGEAVFSANEGYYRGQPLLERLILRTFDSSDGMLDAYKGGLLSGMADVPHQNISELESLGRSVDQLNVATTYGVFAFYKTTHPILADKAVRQALTQAISPRQISQSLAVQSKVMRSPLLPHHLGYDPNLTQVGFSKQEAASVLDQAGWAVGPDGIRNKGGQPLRLTLVSQDTSDYKAVSETVQKAWQEIGVAVDLKLFAADELQRSYVKTHSYDVLIYGIDLGADPDVFAYWHSSQASPPGLNLSEYHSGLADDALASGRTRTDNQLRAAKYRTFAEQWRNDIPAAALYNRYFTYAQVPEASTFTTSRFFHPADRFNNVQLWSIRQTRK